MVASSAEATAIWRESDWQTSSIRYAKIIQLVRSGEDQEAIHQACEELGRNLKNISQLRGILEEPEVPIISRDTYASACK